MSEQRRLSEDSPGDSFIVAKYGLEGVRDHYMPGNRRRGVGVREKRPFETEDETTDFIMQSQRVSPGSVAYQCSVCGKWHIGSRKRV